jgi:CRISPR/Cas system CMR-associated protein Cmr5 small subunit
MALVKISLKNMAKHIANDTPEPKARTRNWGKGRSKSAAKRRAARMRLNAPEIKKYSVYHVDY